jgi:hypothetical protein
MILYASACRQTEGIHSAVPASMMIHPLPVTIMVKMLADKEDLMPNVVSKSWLKSGIARFYA